MKHEFSALTGEEKTIAEGGSAVNLPSKVDGFEGSSEVWNNAGHTEVESLLGDLLETEGILDNFLEKHESLGLVHCACIEQYRRLYCRCQNELNWAPTASDLIPAIISRSSSAGWFPSCMWVSNWSIMALHVNSNLPSRCSRGMSD